MYTDLELMRRSGRILAETLEFLSSGFVVPGMTPLDLSKKADEIIRSYDNAIPAFLDYNGFPACACVSTNEQVVHAIPSADKVLKNGDIVSVDLGVLYKEHYTDACRTIPVGNIGPREKKLIKATRESLNKGIEQAVINNRIGDISYAIQKHIERNGFRVSLDYTGHGIGRKLHDEPKVPNYGPPGIGPLLTEGMCLAIEPVVFDGPTDVWMDPDKWTIYSQNGNLSAHFEDTIIITKTGPEIITRL